MEMAVMTKLMMLADRIRAESSVLEDRFKQTRDSVIKIGDKLIEAKEILGHGNFLPWVEDEFGWSSKSDRIS